MGDVSREYIGGALKLSLAHGFLYPYEVFGLQIAARMLSPDSVIVNIGAGAGTSGLALREAARDAKIYTVDIAEEGNPFGGLENERNAFGNPEFNPRQLALPLQIHGDSKEVGKSWKEPVDLLFIDGDHSIPGVVGDVRAWIPHVKIGGIVIFHDYECAIWADVARVVNYLWDAKIVSRMFTIDTLFVGSLEAYEPESLSVLDTFASSG